MYPVFVKALLLSLLLFQTEESSPFKGEGLAGGGRACNGILRIYPNYLDWETSFSTCDHVPYKTLQSSKNGPWVYQLSPKKGCLYSALEVRQHADGSGTWEASGYKTITAWRKREATPDSDCPMY
jgi:hypothetical protein